jgi:hypothetical protein
MLAWRGWKGGAKSQLDRTEAKTVNSFVFVCGLISLWRRTRAGGSSANNARLHWAAAVEQMLVRRLKWKSKVRQILERLHVAQSLHIAHTFDLF